MYLTKITHKLVLDFLKLIIRNNEKYFYMLLFMSICIDIYNKIRIRKNYQNQVILNLIMIL